MKTPRTPFRMGRFAAIMKKEFLQMKSDKISLRLPVMMILMMMLLFGYAINTDVDQLSTAVFDQDKSEGSRDFVSRFESTGCFRAAYYVQSYDELNALIDGGKAKIGLIIPADFSKNLSESKTAVPQMIVDGTDPTVARSALSYGMTISNAYSMEKKQNEMALRGLRDLKMPEVSLNTRVRYNPNMKSTIFTIPGLVGLILQNITVMLTAFAMVREKERGTIEQLIVTPVKSSELILGKLIPYILVGYMGFLLALTLCRYWFGVSIQGSLPLLLSLGGLFVLCSLSIGMLISTFSKNQLQAMQFTTMIVLPSVLLSGFMFPIESMPQWIQPVSMLFPLTYFMRIDRGIILKGVGLSFLWQDALALALFLLVILTVAIKKFKKSLD